MGFACNEMKYQARPAVFSLLLLLSLGTHPLMADQPTGELSDTQLTEVPGENGFLISDAVSDIEPREVPGENGCRLDITWVYTNNGATPIKVLAKNLCKVCKSVRPDLTLIHSGGRMRVFFNLSNTIEPGDYGGRYLTLNVEVSSVIVRNPNFSCT